MAKIVIDWGHDLFVDKGGTSSKGQPEGKTNLNVAQRVVANLSAKGHEVLLLNPSGKHYTINERIMAAFRFGAQITASIHQNDSENENALGAETFRSMTVKPKESMVLAQCIQKELVAIGAVDRGVKTYPSSKDPSKDGLGMLKVKNSINVLIEGCFLTKKDEGRIDTLAEQWEQGDAITRGILAAIKILGIK